MADVIKHKFKRMHQGTGRWKAFAPVPGRQYTVAETHLVVNGDRHTGEDGTEGDRTIVFTHCLVDAAHDAPRMQ